MSARTENDTGSTPLLKRLFEAYDRAWRRRHNVQPFDEVVSLAIAPYRGQARTLGDGTVINPGDTLAMLHFNHHSFSGDSNGNRAALRFRRDFSRSLQRLARGLETDPALKQVKALYGETWIPPHGRKVGFFVEPLPRTWRRRLQHLYLRFLLRIQFPHLASRNRDTWLYAYWLTRTQLQQLPEQFKTLPHDND